MIIVSCIYVPYNIAFISSDDLESQVIEGITSSFFGIDIILCFFSATYDIDFRLIEEWKELAFNYLKGWFLIDFISVLPLSNIINLIQTLDNMNINGIARIVRLSRISRIIRVIRLIRVIKIFQERGRLLNQTRQLL